MKQRTRERAGGAAKALRKELVDVRAIALALYGRAHANEIVAVEVDRKEAALTPAASPPS